MADPASHPAAPAEPRPHLTAPAPAADQEVALKAAALEAGRRLFAGPCRFFFGARTLDQVPAPGAIEVAFAGRSNVGKSSLVNALTGQRALARASGQPGRTRQLNFFDLGEGRLTLVDMPGYGYAQASREVKADWQDMMFDYLRGRPTLRRVILLLDARIEVKAVDRAVMTLLDKAAVTFQVALTKADGVKPPVLAAKRAEAEALVRAHPAAHPEVIATSATNGLGIPELRAALAGLVA